MNTRTQRKKYVPRERAENFSPFIIQLYKCLTIRVGDRWTVWATGPRRGVYIFAYPLDRVPRRNGKITRQGVHPWSKYNICCQTNPQPCRKLHFPGSYEAVFTHPEIGMKCSIQDISGNSGEAFSRRRNQDFGKEGIQNQHIVWKWSTITGWRVPYKAIFDPMQSTLNCRKQHC